MALSHAALVIGSEDEQRNWLSWIQNGGGWTDSETGEDATWEDGNDAIFYIDKNGGVNVNQDIVVNSITRLNTLAGEGGMFRILGKNNSATNTSITINSFIQGDPNDPKQDMSFGRNLDVYGDFEVRNISHLNLEGGDDNNRGATIYGTITMTSSTTGVRLQGADLSNATLRMTGQALDVQKDTSINHLSGSGRFFSGGSTENTLTVQNLTIGANADGSGGLGSFVQTSTGALNVIFGGGDVRMTVELGTDLSDVFQIKGQLTLGGNLVINTLGTGDFKSGDSYTLFQADGGIVGDFDSITLPKLEDGLEWIIDRDSNSWTITVSDKIPEPTSLALLGLGAAAATLRRRRR
ncbi:PEP-CTERM sorting domain-containing protein [Persicirhabdus sediminis]|uniref:PEP-CTERM sorting domain-containing protein n=2 Tax=Persicirhabdus sediminis TaxID=454144 RepID=A0A8J7MDN0_9BACT|nr:PEP-CTERM sorting domain-containing protein [Persicirhabdus sediminis]